MAAGGPRPFLELIMANMIGAAELPKRKGINIRICRRRLASVQSRPDSGSQTSGRAG